MNQRRDLDWAVEQRERSRGRVRLATVAVGAAGLAAAGVVAVNLPGPAHTTVNGSATTPATGQPSPATQLPADDGGDSAGSAATVPGSSGALGPAHATSGGS